MSQDGGETHERMVKCPTSPSPPPPPSLAPPARSGGCSHSPTGPAPPSPRRGSARRRRRRRRSSRSPAASIASSARTARSTPSPGRAASTLPSTARRRSPWLTARSSSGTPRASRARASGSARISGSPSRAGLRLYAAFAPRSPPPSSPTKTGRYSPPLPESSPSGESKPRLRWSRLAQAADPPGSAQQLRLLARKLVVAEDALGMEVGELLELLDVVVRAGRGRHRSAWSVHAHEALRCITEKLSHRRPSIVVGDARVRPLAGVLSVVPNGIPISLTGNLNTRDRRGLLRVERRRAIDRLDAEDHLHPRVVVDRHPCVGNLNDGADSLRAGSEQLLRLFLLAREQRHQSPPDSAQPTGSATTLCDRETRVKTPERRRARCWRRSRR